MHLRVFNKVTVVDNIEGQDTKIRDDDTKLKIINDPALELYYRQESISIFSSTFR